MSENDDQSFDPFGAGGFSIGIPPEIVEAMKAQHEKAHMHAEAAAARVENFITGLDVDGLLALRTILCQGDLAQSPTANFWDGQLVSILKYVHHVDPRSGKDPLATMEEPTE